MSLNTQNYTVRWKFWYNSGILKTKSQQINSSYTLLTGRWRYSTILLIFTSRLCWLSNVIFFWRTFIAPFLTLKGHSCSRWLRSFNHIKASNGELHIICSLSGLTTAFPLSAVMISFMMNDCHALRILALQLCIICISIRPGFSCTFQRLLRPKMPDVAAAFVKKFLKKLLCFYLLFFFVLFANHLKTETEGAFFCLVQIRLLFIWSSYAQWIE